MANWILQNIDFVRVPNAKYFTETSFQRGLGFSFAKSMDFFEIFRTVHIFAIIQVLGISQEKSGIYQILSKI